MPDFGAVHHINFTVTDLGRSTAWYKAVLDLDDGWQMDDLEGRWQKTILLHRSEPLRIVLVAHGINSGEPFSEFRTGMDHVAFAVRDRAELAEWADRFRQLGVVHSEIKQGATGWLITFRDPDGIQMEMYTLNL